MSLLYIDAVLLKPVILEIITYEGLYMLSERVSTNDERLEPCDICD